MPAPSVPASLAAWVDECALLTRPARIVWCDGSAAEYQGLVEGLLKDAYPGE